MKRALKLGAGASRTGGHAGEACGAQAGWLGLLIVRHVLLLTMFDAGLVWQYRLAFGG